MKRFSVIAVLLWMTAVAMAQQAVTGRVIDPDEQEGVPMATVKLLKSDSTMAVGDVTDTNGNFRLKAPAGGKYILQVTFVGYKAYTKNITVSTDKDLAMGNIKLESDAILLQGAVVEGHAAKVTLRADTFVYNASAYRTPEGSVVEELVRRLPGAEVSDDGTITINGKTVKKILVDGKEFMTGDTKTAMKNLPTSIVDRIKAYDQKSDLARVSGIDDGEEQTVLDFGIKPGMNRGLFSNIDLAAGTHDRYSGRLMGARFSDGLKTMLFASANNTNDMGFPGGGGFGRFGGGRQGLTASKMLGFNVNYEKKGVVKLDGSIRWNHSDGDQWTRRSSQNFLGEQNQYTNSLAQNYSRSNSWNGQMRVEWTPDTMTNIMFRPQLRYNSSDGENTSSEATFDSDPYAFALNTASQQSLIDQMAEEGLVKNSRTQQSISYSDSKSIGGTLQLNRRLSNNGRNVTLVLGANSGSGSSKSLSTSNVELYQVLNTLGTDSTYQTNRWNLTPTKNHDYSLRATYSEPVARQTYLQFSYQYQYKYTKSDRSTYDFSNVGIDFSDLSPFYRGWDQYLSRLGSPMESYLDDDLSRFSEYRNYIHTAEVMLRVVRKAYNFNVGMQVIPQRSHFTQDYQGVHTDTTRNVTNFTPTADFRWKISNVSQLRFNYRGQSSQPSMTDLLDITDNSDPLNITKGNPGLKPAFTQSFRLFYNNYIQARQRAVMANVNFSTTRNSISNMVTYDAQTGGRTTRPENINGNWNAQGFFMFNTAVDSAGYFNVNTSTNLGYNHYVGYVSPQRNASSQKSVTRSTTLGERLAASYRNAWIEFELTGSLTYVHSRNDLQATADLDTWQFAYGFNTNVTLPWGTRIATDMGMNSRRGYSDASMNTNELIWNAQLSHSFLKGNALTLSLQFYDILHQQSTISRTINAMMRSDVESNAINSYAMLHVIYRFNAFGGQNSMRGGPGGGGDRPGFGGGGGRGGTRGGFGGGGFGRPGRF
ncbi:MAG: TonB-dependent receptor [Prevotella sp.]|nr:TonB-dependent receptor [Prevotella sp.]